MADFKLTRQQALTTLSSNLREIAYMTALCGWKHVTGAWLVVSITPGFETCYTVHWRASDYWMCGKLEFCDAFECVDKDAAWARALASAESAWSCGPAEPVLDAAAITTKNKLDGNTRGGQKSGKVRAAQAEARKDALALAKKYGIAMLPNYDPRAWTFNPSYDTRDVPVLNFTWAKQEHTYAYIKPDGADGWQIGRGWYPHMNEDNGRIEEIVANHVGETLKADDPAILMFERLLKTNPEKWLRGDYSLFE